MNKVFQSIIITLMSAMIPFFSSCSDDDSVNEWDMSYVSLLPADYLRPTPSFTLKHVEEEGIEGSVEFQFMATTQKAVTQDINVHYSVTCDGIDANKINLSAKNLLIKAGSTASEPITLSITDWKYLENTKEALEYTLKIKIADIESTSAEVTNAAYYQEIVLKISKTAEKKKESVTQDVFETPWLRRLLELKDIEELDRDIIVEMIDQITVYENRKLRHQTLSQEQERMTLLQMEYLSG